MSTFHFTEQGSATLERAGKLLAGFPGEAEKAAKRAMSRAVSHLRTSASKAIREKYDISATNIRANENVGIRYQVYPGGITADVMYRGNKIPLYRYNGTSPKEPTQDKSRRIAAQIDGTFKMVHPGKAASAHQLIDSPTTRFDHAFVAKMRSGHKGIFERTGGETHSGSDEIRELMGSSVPQMLGNDAVAEGLGAAAMEKFEERLDHEIDVIINGWR